MDEAMRDATRIRWSRGISTAGVFIWMRYVRGVDDIGNEVLTDPGRAVSRGEAAVDGVCANGENVSDRVGAQTARET